MYGQWDEKFIREQKPSIEYLELYALTAGVITWADQISNCLLTVHCDNIAVVHMVNNLTSGCNRCMILLRMLVLDGLRHNRKLFAVYISTKNNFLSDSLSRLKVDKFRKLALPDVDKEPTPIAEQMLPMSKLWM